MSLVLIRNKKNIITPFVILGEGDISICKAHATTSDDKPIHGIKFSTLNKRYKLREYVSKDDINADSTIGLLFKTKDDYDNMIQLLTELKEVTDDLQVIP